MSKMVIFALGSIGLLTICMMAGMFGLFALTSDNAPKWLSNYMLFTQAIPLLVFLATGLMHLYKVFSGGKFWPFSSVCMYSLVIYLLSAILLFVFSHFKLFGLQ